MSSHNLQNQSVGTLPRDEKSTDPKSSIRGNTKIGPVLDFFVRMNIDQVPESVQVEKRRHQHAEKRSAESGTTPSVPRIGSSLVEMRDPQNALQHEKWKACWDHLFRHARKDEKRSATGASRARDAAKPSTNVTASGLHRPSGLNSDHDKLTPVALH